MVRLALREVDTLYVVTAPELPSLHLARRSIAGLDRTSELKDRVRVVLNRSSLHDPLRGSDIAKLFNRPVDAVIPNDYLALQEAMKLAVPVNPKTRLGQAIRSLWRDAAPRPTLTTRITSLFRSRPRTQEPRQVVAVDEAGICQASEGGRFVIDIS